MPTKRKRGERYPVEFVASEFGVDRKTFIRRLEAKNIDYSKGVTIREGFSAWTSKDERDADRARQQKAEADSAELDAAKKRGELMFTKDAEVLWADRTIAWRKVIQARDSWKSPDLLKELAKIKLDEEQ